LQRAPGTKDTDLVTEIENDECVFKDKSVVFGWIITYDLVSSSLSKPRSDRILEVVDHGQITHEETRSFAPDTFE
jgi:hypothetical protein